LIKNSAMCFVLENSAFKTQFLRHLPFLPKMQKGLFVLFVHHAK